jgi:predicted RNA-binding Zn ribbon-like protein
MPRICTICTHPKHSEIDRRLLAGEPVRAIVRAISGHVPISKTSLQRHQQHVSEAISKSQEAVEIAHGDDLVSELQQLASEARRLQAKAEADGDTRTAIAALRELTRLIELRARVAGELKDRQVNVLNVSLDESTATRMAELYLSRRKTREVLTP